MPPTGLSHFLNCAKAPQTLFSAVCSPFLTSRPALLLPPDMAFSRPLSFAACNPQRSAAEMAKCARHLLCKCARTGGPAPTWMFSSPFLEAGSLNCIQQVLLPPVQLPSFLQGSAFLSRCCSAGGIGGPLSQGGQMLAMRGCGSGNGTGTGLTPTCR